MRYVNLNDTCLRISAVALGTGALGSRVDDKTSLKIMDTFVGEGGTFIDTANIYGRWNPGNKPLSEMLIGRWMSFHHLREKLVIATKGACDNIGEVGIKRLGRDQIRGDLEDSLKNLRTDYIDLYYLHHDDPSRPAGEIIETMNELVDEGKIRYFGCSNWSAARMKDAREYALAHGKRFFSADEIMFNMAHANEEAVAGENQTHIDRAIYEFHNQTQLPLVSYTSQAAGIFSLYERSDFLTDPKYTFPKNFFYNPVTLKRAERVRALSMLTRSSPLEIALGYLFAQPFQVIPIVGPWSVDEIRTSVDSMDRVLRPEEIEFIMGKEEGGNALM